MEPTYQSQALDHLGLVAGMYDELKIGEVIDQAIPQDMEKRNISLGQAVKAMVLNGLGFINQQLYLVSSFFENKPVSRLIAPEVKAAYLNDDALGRALDDLYEYGVSELFYQIGMQAASKLELEGKFLHIDSTSFHVDGNYNSDNEEEEGVIQITKGYSRDHRPDLNQVILEMITENQAGIPLLMKPLSGNASDKTEFSKMIEEYAKALTPDIPGSLYIVSDSALYSKGNIGNLEKVPGLHWLSRVPETILEAQDAIQNVSFETMTVFEDEGYRYKSKSSEYGGVQQRWLIVHSDQAEIRALKSTGKSFLKKSEKESKAFEKLCRQEFACIPDAENAALKFSKNLEYTGLSGYEIVEKRKSKGKGRWAKKNGLIEVFYQIDGGLSCSIKQYEALLFQKSSFVLATNELNEEKLSNEEMLRGYKGQSVVERGFRFLKDPMFFASSLYLKSPKRIMALLMVMTICLLVYAALEYRIRKELVARGQKFPNQKRKLINKPTARWVFQYFVGIHLLIINKVETLILNLREEHKLILKLLGCNYESIYL